VYGVVVPGGRQGEHGARAHHGTRLGRVHDRARPGFCAGDGMKIAHSGVECWTEARRHLEPTGDEAVDGHRGGFDPHCLVHAAGQACKVDVQPGPRSAYNGWWARQLYNVNAAREVWAPAELDMVVKDGLGQGPLEGHFDERAARECDGPRLFSALVIHVDVESVSSAFGMAGQVDGEHVRFATERPKGVKVVDGVAAVWQQTLVVDHLGNLS